MKTKVKLTMAALVMGFMGFMGLMAQSNPPAPISITNFIVPNTGGLTPVQVFGNLPPIDTNSTVFFDGKLELRVGAVQQGVTGSGYESSVGASYFFTTNLAICGDVVNGGSATIDGVHLGMEFVYPMKGIRLGAFILGGRNLAGDTWEGKLGVRLSYVPMSESAPNLFVYAEAFFLATGKSSFQGSQPVNFSPGIGYRF